MTEPPPDASPRPATVTAAYWTWLASAVALLLSGMLSLSIAGGPLRDRLTEDGRSPADIDNVVTLVRGFAVISALVGVAVALLAAPVCRRAHARLRRALTALSVVFAVLLLLALGLGLTDPILAVVTVVLLLASSALIYRPSSGPWFAADRTQ